MLSAIRRSDGKIVSAYFESKANAPFACPVCKDPVFDKVDAILTKRWRYSPSENKSVPKPFLGLLRCAGCGGAITAEQQKGHTYYRCTKKGKLVTFCTQPYIREKALDLEISSLLRPFALDPRQADEMLTSTKWGDQGDGTYRNPIIPSDFPKLFSNGA